MTKNGGSFTIADVTVAPGQTGFGAFEAAYLQDSSPVRIPLTVVNGAHDGPVLWRAPSSSWRTRGDIAVSSHLPPSTEFGKPGRGSNHIIPLLKSTKDMML